MAFTNRVIWRSGSSLIDLSQSMNNYLSGSKLFALKSATDALYLGSDLPFNHRWFDLKEGNSENSQLTIQVWSGSHWQNTVDLFDQTLNDQATFAQSGHIAFVPDRNKSSWSRADSTEHISDLLTLKIYNLFWIKIIFSADLSAETELNYIGHRFSDDYDLRAQYPELFNSDLMQALGALNWNEKHAVAAEYIIRDLMRNDALQSSNQILDWEIFRNAGVHRAASLIYYSMGPAYQEHFNQAMSLYKQALDLKYLRIDQSSDGSLDPHEMRTSTSWLSR